MNTRLAQQTVIEIEEACEGEKTAAIGEIIRIIQELASNAFRVSIRELADLIGRDPAITEKVITAANTLAYKENANQVVTISDAIHTVGFEKIRNLAITLMLAENAGRASNSAEQREAAALAVCSGLMAQNLVEEFEDEHDADFLFVCASLRNFGHLLMSTYLVERYRDARKEARYSCEREAFRNEFGVTPLELGRHILKMSGMPKAIMANLAMVSQEQLKREADQENAVHLYSALSARVCEIALDSHLSPEEFNENLSLAVAPFRRSLGVSRERVLQSLVSVEREISSLNRMIGISDDCAPAVRKLKARISGDPLKQRVQGDAVKSSFPVEQIMKIEEESVVSTQDGSTAIDAEVDRIDRRVKTGQEMNMQQTYQGIAEAIRDVLNLDNCFIFVPEDFEPNQFSARYGVGDLFRRVKNRPLAQTGNGDVFSICMNRKEDILIGDVRSGKTRSVIPDWISDYSDINSFFILPAKMDTDLFALIFGSVSKGSPIVLRPMDIRSLKNLRKSLAEVRRLVFEGKIVVV